MMGSTQTIYSSGVLYTKLSFKKGPVTVKNNKLLSCQLHLTWILFYFVSVRKNTESGHSFKQGASLKE